MPWVVQLANPVLLSVQSWAAAGTVGIAQTVSH